MVKGHLRAMQEVKGSCMTSMHESWIRMNFVQFSLAAALHSTDPFSLVVPIDSGPQIRAHKHVHMHSSHQFRDIIGMNMPI